MMSRLMAKSVPPELRVNTLAEELQRAREKDTPMRLGYHGTHSREVAERILEEGFKLIKEAD